MPIPHREQKLVALSSGGICAFPGCGAKLVNTEADEPTIVGELAHIVAEQRQGPRGREDFTEAERNKASNILLLCSEHHTLIDRNPLVFSVHVLRQIKKDHEARMTVPTHTEESSPKAPLISETVHSTLLCVSQIPKFVYSAPCDYNEKQKKLVSDLISYEKIPRDEHLPFILRDGHLFAFQNLTNYGNPFSKIVNPLDAFDIPTSDFCSEPEGRRRFVSLLNSAIGKHCGRRRVFFDRLHHRFYFTPFETGVERSESYRTLTGRNDSRNVVWNPKIKSTGMGRPFWYHLAAGLSFHQMADDQWCLSIRPERHVTKDGETPYNPKYVGRKVTSLKARMFNDAYLGEVHFWRDFLSGGKPRFILNFGAQSAIVDTELIPIQVNWTGIPTDSKSFSNQVFEDDLFSFGELQSATGDDNEAEYYDENE